MLVANRVRKFRTERGVGLRELAREVGMTPGHLSRLERRPRLYGCSDEKMLALARYFGVPVTDLFFIEEEAAAPA